MQQKQTRPAKSPNRIQINLERTEVIANPVNKQRRTDDANTHLGDVSFESRKNPQKDSAKTSINPQQFAEQPSIIATSDNIQHQKSQQLIQTNRSEGITLGVEEGQVHQAACISPQKTQQTIMNIQTISEPADPTDQINLLLGFEERVSTNNQVAINVSQRSRQIMNKMDSSEVIVTGLDHAHLQRSDKHSEPRLLQGAQTSPFNMTMKGFASQKLNDKEARKFNNYTKQGENQMPSKQISSRIGLKHDSLKGNLANYRAEDVQKLNHNHMQQVQQDAADKTVLNFLASQKSISQNVRQRVGSASRPVVAEENQPAQNQKIPISSNSKKSGGAFSKKSGGYAEMNRIQKQANTSPTKILTSNSAQKTASQAQMISPKNFIGVTASQNRAQLKKPPSGQQTQNNQNSLASQIQLSLTKQNNSHYTKGHHVSKAPSGFSLASAAQALSQAAFGGSKNNPPSNTRNRLERQTSTGFLQSAHKSSVTTASKVPGSTVLKRAGSNQRTDKLETQIEAKKAQNAFTRIGLPNLYKLDKLQYQRADIAEIGQKLGKKLDEIEHLLDYERRKQESLSREKLDLHSQVQQLLFQQSQLETDRKAVREQVQNQKIVVNHLSNCLNALKDSMIHNYVCLDFYKDMQFYVSENQLEATTSPDLVHHLNEIHRIIDDNNISAVQYDSNLLEQIRDECADFLQSLDMEARRTVTIDLQEGCGEAESNVDVREIHPINLMQNLDHSGGSSALNLSKTGQKTNEQRQRSKAFRGENRSGSVNGLNSLERGTGTGRQSRDGTPGGQSRIPWDKHHANCTQDTTQMLRSEVHAKQLQISKLATERDQLKRRVVELKAEISKIKEKQWKKQQVEQLRNQFERADADLKISKSLNQRNEIELVRLREENQKFATDIKQMNDALQIQTNVKNECKMALEDAEHFQGLRDAVNHITGMLVSKSHTDLTQQQKTSLQAIFGDSSVLHTLKTRLTESENHGHKMASLLVRLMKIAGIFRVRLNEHWKNLIKIVSSFDEIKVEDIENYQILIAKNLVSERYEKCRIQMLDQQIENENVTFMDLKRELQSVELMEQISKVTADDGEKRTSFIDNSFLQNQNNMSMISGGVSQNPLNRNRSIPARQRGTVAVSAMDRIGKSAAKATASRQRSRRSKFILGSQKSDLDLTGGPVSSLQIETGNDRNVTKRKTEAICGATSVQSLLKLHNMQLNQEAVGGMNIDDNKSDNLSHALRDVAAKSPRNERELARGLKLGRPEHIQLELFEEANRKDKSADFLGDPITQIGNPNLMTPQVANTDFRQTFGQKTTLQDSDAKILALAGNVTKKGQETERKDLQKEKKIKIQYQGGEREKVDFTPSKVEENDHFRLDAQMIEVGGPLDTDGECPLEFAPDGDHAEVGHSPQTKKERRLEAEALLISTRSANLIKLAPEIDEIQSEYNALAALQGDNTHQSMLKQRSKANQNYNQSCYDYGKKDVEDFVNIIGNSQGISNEQSLQEEDKKAANMRNKSSDKLQRSQGKIQQNKKSGVKEIFEFDNLFRQSDDSDDASAMNKSQNRWQSRTKRRKKSQLGHLRNTTTSNAIQKAEVLKEENSDLKKAMEQMQEKYSQLLKKQERELEMHIVPEPVEVKPFSNSPYKKQVSGDQMSDYQQTNQKLGNIPIQELKMEEIANDTNLIGDTDLIADSNLLLDSEAFEMKNSVRISKLESIDEKLNVEANSSQQQDSPLINNPYNK